MSEVFYRKWRPRRLDQVVGQGPVTQTLRQAVSQGRVAHAYLFCGPRGTGKTSTARILAKAVNCQSPQEGEPDDLCDMCQAISEGRALDLIEIDAASNRGIDDIRSLNEKIRFSPNEAGRKVYIVDEVHMLTEHAFNALLKTLEEPPDHAILILATTEVQKVPATIVSRCQRFDFRRIQLDAMVERLTSLCRDEHVEVAPEALALIARTARGSLRDAENLLEQAVVSYGPSVTEANVRELLGLGGDEKALDIVERIIRRDVPGVLTLVNQVAGQGNDLRQLHRGVMEYLREVLLARSGAGMSPGYPEDTVAQVKSLAGATSMVHLLHTLKTFAGVDLRRDSSFPLPLELAAVESATESATEPARVAPRPVRSPASPASTSQRSRAGDREPRQRPPSTPGDRQPAAAPTILAEPPPKVESGMPHTASSEPGAKLEAEWHSVIRALRHAGKRFKVGPLLRGCRDREVTDGLITLKFPYASHVERMREELDDPETRRAIREAFSGVMEGEYDVKVAQQGDDAGRPSQNAAQRSPLVRAARSMGARVVDEREERQS